MQRLHLDFETFWADDFTLKKMTPVEYILDPRFEVLGCSLGTGDMPPFWVDGPNLDGVFRAEWTDGKPVIDWSQTMTISHNALFDALILALHYGIYPAAYGDTLSMARNWLSHKLPSLSLASVAEYYGMPPKWGTAHKFKGMNFHAIRQQPQLYNEMMGYANDDNIKCRTIFGNIMADGFPPGELETIDMVIRMTTQPAFELDNVVLAEHLNDVRAKKAALLEACHMEAGDVSSLLSDQQLAVKLLFLGVDIPMKTSKTTGKPAYAFAKSDKEFTKLLDHDNPMVQAIVAARLGHKSTLEETRTQRLLTIGGLVDKMPVPLNYSGAHTHRLGGTWNINLQNLPRGGQLRRAFKAPRGKKVVTVDAMQIEARFNAYMAGERDLVEAFRTGRDIYADFAEQIYGHPVVKAEHPLQRFVGKTAILSLGYGSSWLVFQNMCRLQGNVNLTERDAAGIVMLYRTMFPKIVDHWTYANNTILPRLSDSRTHTDAIAASLIGGASGGVMMWGPMVVLKHALRLPNGNHLRYLDLHRELVDGRWEWRFNRAGTSQKIYGAKLIENICQALSFIHIMETAKRVKRITNGRFMPVHQVHDELIYIVDEDEADWCGQLVSQEMSVSPIWMPEIPLAAEAHVGPNYGAAK